MDKYDTVGKNVYVVFIKGSYYHANPLRLSVATHINKENPINIKHWILKVI